MGFLDKISSIKLPDSKKVIAIPSDIKTKSKQLELNTVDVLFFSQDWKNGILITGIKRRLAKRAIIELSLPEKLSFFEADDSSVYNKSTNRDLYIVNEKSSFTINPSKIPVASCMIKLNPSHDENKDDEVLEVDLTPKMLSTLGTVRLIDDINEKSNDGLFIVFLLGLLIGSPIWFGLAIYLMS